MYPSESCVVIKGPSRLVDRMMEREFEELEIDGDGRESMTISSFFVRFFLSFRYTFVWLEWEGGFLSFYVIYYLI